MLEKERIFFSPFTFTWKGFLITETKKNGLSFAQN